MGTCTPISFDQSGDGNGGDRACDGESREAVKLLSDLRLDHPECFETQGVHVNDYRVVDRAVVRRRAISRASLHML